jgi:hypothetical protein
MSKSNKCVSDYFLALADHEGASLFPSGLLMYDLPSSRRTASRTLNNVGLSSRQSSLSQKRSSSPVPSVGQKLTFIDRELSCCIYLVFIVSFFNSR